MRLTLWCVSDLGGLVQFFSMVNLKVSVPPNGILHTMDCLDCPICYEAITAATGKIELACYHSFHINCLATWFASQQAQNCPYCRHESTELEVIPTCAPDYQYRLIREMRTIHHEIENRLRAEIFILTANLHAEEARTDQAFDRAEVAEETARIANEALYAYKVAEQALKAVAQKQERKENWNTWSAAARAK